MAAMGRKRTVAYGSGADGYLRIAIGQNPKKSRSFFAAFLIQPDYTSNADVRDGPIDQSSLSLWF